MALKEFAQQYKPELDPFMGEVLNDKLLNDKYGREFGAWLHMRHHSPEVLAQHPEIRGPLLYWNRVESPLSQQQGWEDHNVLEQHQKLQGWKEFEGTTSIFGTSNCRADSSEQIKMLGVSEALMRSGIPAERARTLYFIDPCAHTVHELLKDMGEDMGRDGEFFLKSLPLSTRRDIEIPNGHLAEKLELPPYFYQSPSPDVIAGLDIPKELKKIMMQAAESAQGQDLGTMRIALDTLLIENYLQKLGYDPSLIQVKSLEDILSESKEIPIGQVAERARHAWDTYRPLIFGKKGDAASDRPPVVLRYVWNGQRINIDANMRAFEENVRDGRKYIEDPEVLSFVSQLPDMSVHHLMTHQPTNLGGVGYALTSAILAENAKAANSEYNQEDPLTMFMVDHYTLPNNMGIMGMEVMRAKGVNAMWITKGTEGRMLPDGREDYWTPADLYTKLLRPSESLERDRAMIDLLANVLMSNDVHTHAGFYYDTMHHNQVGPKFVPVPSKTVELISHDGSLPQAQYDIRLPHMERKEAWRLVNGLRGLTPAKVGEVVFGFRYDKDQHTQVADKLNTYPELKRALQTHEYIVNTLGLGDFMPEEFSIRTNEVLSDLCNASKRSVELFQHLQDSVHEEDWVIYWKNRIEGYEKAAQQYGVALEIPECPPTAHDMKNLATRIDQLFEAELRKKRKQEFFEQREPEIQSLNAQMKQIDTGNREYVSIRNLLFMVQRLEGTTDPKKRESLSKTIQQKVEESGLSSDISQDELASMLPALKPKLVAQIHEFLPFIDQTIRIDVEQTQRNNKKYEEGMVVPGEEVEVFDQKGNISDAFNMRWEYVKVAVGVLGKVSDLVRWYESGEHDEAGTFIEQHKICRQLAENLRTPTGNPVYLTEELIDEIDSLWKMMNSKFDQRVNDEFGSIKETVDRYWTEANDRTVADKLHVKEEYDRLVAEEVHKVKNRREPELEELYTVFMSYYKAWRESMIHAIATQGFTYNH